MYVLISTPLVLVALVIILGSFLSLEEACWWLSGSSKKRLGGSKKLLGWSVEAPRRVLVAPRIVLVPAW